MRIVRTARAVVAAPLAAAALLVPVGAAAADSPSPSADPSAGPTEAGTSFRTATPFQPGRTATADASTGDYLYWRLPLDTGARATVKATVRLPESARHGDATWQLDVYDGLRRHQACRYGAQSRTAAKDASSVELSCALRTVRGWAEPWANDPLPGSYFVRLTVTDLPQEDLGLPVRAEVEATVSDAGGARAVDGSLGAPLVPGTTVTDAKSDAEETEETGKTDKADDSGEAGEGGASPEASDRESVEAAAEDPGEPEGGWSSGWWSSRWVWTLAGGLLAALAGIAGYTVTRGTGRPSRVPPTA